VAAEPSVVAQSCLSLHRTASARPLRSVDSHVRCQRNDVPSFAETWHFGLPAFHAFRHRSSARAGPGGRRAADSRDTKSCYGRPRRPRAPPQFTVVTASPAGRFRLWGAGDEPAPCDRERGSVVLPSGQARCGVRLGDSDQPRSCVIWRGVLSLPLRPRRPRLAATRTDHRGVPKSALRWLPHRFGFRPWPGRQASASLANSLWRSAATRGRTSARASFATFVNPQ
jgi:hypothetical protein